MIPFYCTHVGEEVWVASYYPGAWREIDIFPASVISHDSYGCAVWGSLPNHNGTNLTIGITFVRAENLSRLNIFSTEKEAREHKFGDV